MTHTRQAQVLAIPTGIRGFDCNTNVSPAAADAFYTAGYRFAVRYVRRVTHHSYDLTVRETMVILNAGLGLMIVQHVANPGWTPTGDMGARYGETAVAECKALGIPDGVMLWCDLEGVKIGTPAHQVIQFCNRWYGQVIKARYMPGLYVGYDPGLTAEELYRRLRFEHYWAAYNLNRDQYPAVRGVQMQQGPYPGRNRPGAVPGVEFEFDTNAVKADALGGLPTCLALEGWPER